MRSLGRAARSPAQTAPPRGATAAKMAEAVSARAFAAGKRIGFARGARDEAHAGIDYAASPPHAVSTFAAEQWNALEPQYHGYAVELLAGIDPTRGSAAHVDRGRAVGCRANLVREHR